MTTAAPAPRVGRPKSPGETRTAILRTRVKPSAKAEFERVCAMRGIDPADAMRDALAAWIGQPKS